MRDQKKQVAKAAQRYNKHIAEEAVRLARQQARRKTQSGQRTGNSRRSGGEKPQGQKATI